MTTDLDQVLGQFDERSYSVRLVRGVCKVVPFAEDPGAWFSLVEGLKIADEGAKKPTLDKVIAISKEEKVQRALWAITALDTADSGISVFSGVKSAYKMYQATDTDERIDALETDTQQAVDAVIKAIAIAYVIHKLYDGSITEKIGKFRKSDTGKAILFYYAAIEVGLPFTDNALSGGATFLKSLFDKYGPDQQKKFAAVAGEEEAEAAMGVLDKLTGPLGTMVETASEYLTPISDAVVEYLPRAMAVGDKAAGVAATGADLLPVYRYLGARLVAEECIRRALTQAETVEFQATGTTSDGSRASAGAGEAIVYTRSKDDLPDAPKKRRGCFGLFGLALAVIMAGSAGVIGWLA
jgi:hypothetical protein